MLDEMEKKLVELKAREFTKYLKDWKPRSDEATILNPKSPQSTRSKAKPTERRTQPTQNAHEGIQPQPPNPDAYNSGNDNRMNTDHDANDNDHDDQTQSQQHQQNLQQDNDQEMDIVD